MPHVLVKCVKIRLCLQNFSRKRRLFITNKQQNFLTIKMSIPYFMAALVFFWTNCISWSPFSQVAHLKVFSQQGFNGAVFPVFRGMLICVSVLSLRTKRFSTGSSRKLEQERKRGIKEDWGRGEKEPLPEISQFLKSVRPRTQLLIGELWLCWLKSERVSLLRTPSPSSPSMALVPT